MREIKLSGEWAVKRADTDFEISALVPGDIYADLLRNKKIPDPYYRDNEKKLQWIGECDWIYTREFEIDNETLMSDKVLLSCEGLDTLATVKINGHLIAETDNMFRNYEWNVKEYLKFGVNNISVFFKSAYHYCEERAKERKMPCSGQTTGYDKNWIYHLPHKINTSLSWIRKEQCNFGWDWGPMLLTCGIWKDIKLIAYNSLRLKDIYISQNHNSKDVELDIRVDIENSRKINAAVKLFLEFENNTVHEEIIYFNDETINKKVTVTNPQLWWPNGLGKQHLYNLKIELTDESENLVDLQEKRFGLRTVRLVREKDQWGESFKFSVNGIEIFIKGSDWIPADGVLANIPDERYKILLKAAVKANMNMVRLWGGGIYEKEIFYNTCDELGLLVWHDFMYACAGYPAFDKDFIKTVEAETRDNLKRLRHHPCIALWCGNNELEMHSVGKEWTNETMSWDDYKKLFDELLPSLVNELCPEIAYWPSSPHSPYGDRKNFNNPECGNAHLWDVWHMKKPFEWYFTCYHRFISEFGFQSFPEPKTIYTYTVPLDRNVTSYIMEYHQRSDIGNATIMHYMLDWFKLPFGFENTIWVSQILQAMAIKHAIEHWRSNMPRTMGAIYWQLNDTWPGPSWSSIDYFCRWKALHYEAKKFYSQLLICGFKQEDNSVDIYIVNDRLKDKNLTATISITDMYGKEFYHEILENNVPKQTSIKIKSFDPVKAAVTLRPKNLLIWLKLEKDNKVVSTNLVLIEKPKHLKFHTAKFNTQIMHNEDNSFDVKIISNVPSLWTWFELKDMDAEFEDNFFHLPSDIPCSINIKPEKPLSIESFREQLIIRNITNTY